MAGKAVERKEFDLTSRVNRVESTTSKQTVRGQYKTDERGNRITIVKGESVNVPYSYFKIVVGKIPNIKELQGALADINERGECPVSRLIDDINYGLEHNGRSYFARGLDPAMNDKQRETIERIRGLMDDGLVDLELAAQWLDKVGLNADQIAVALS